MDHCWRFPGGRPLGRRCVTVLISAHRGCEGPQALQACSDHRCHERMGHSWRFPGGRPLRRRRVSVDFGCRRLRGTAALQACSDHRCHERMDHSWRFPGGRPLRRRREMVLISAAGGCEGPQPREDRRQKTEFRTPNLKPRTPNLKPSRPAAIIVATNGCWRKPWRASFSSQPSREGTLARQEDQVSAPVMQHGLNAKNRGFAE
jgi:hypothetical protein